MSFCTQASSIMNSSQGHSTKRSGKHTVAGSDIAKTFADNSIDHENHDENVDEDDESLSLSEDDEPVVDTASGGAGSADAYALNQN